MIDGNISGVASYGTGGIIALLSIAMVFIVLIVIIALTEAISKVAGKGDDKQTNIKPVLSNNTGALPLNINDEDATVACLVASIDMRNETKKMIASNIVLILNHAKPVLNVMDVIKMVLRLKLIV